MSSCLRSRRRERARLRGPRTAVAGVLLLSAACCVHATGLAQPAIVVGCSDRARTFELTPAARTVALARSADSAWLEFRELGQQMKIAASPDATVIDLSQPLRFASRWVHTGRDAPIRVALADAGMPRSTFSVVAHCDGMQARADWLARLAPIDAAIVASRTEASLREALAGLDALAPTAPTPGDAALVIHYRALAMFGLNRTNESVELFRRAEDAWQKAGEVQRSLAARVGWIQSEVAAGRFGDVIAASQRAAPRLRIVPYFSARIVNERCLSLDETGRLEAAGRCFRDLLAQYRQLHEMNDYAATLENLANVERKRGRMAAARALTADGLKSVSGPYAPLIRGRLYSLLGALDRQTGNIAAAFHDSQLADAEFRHAGIESLTRRALGRLYEAMLLEETGAHYEAYAGLASVWTFLSPANAPRVVALSAMVFSDLAKDTHHPDLALVWMRVAEAMCAHFDNKPLYEVTRLARLRLQLERGDLAVVEQGLAEPRYDLPLYEPQWRLLEAELDVRRDRVDAARRALATVRAAPLAFPEQIQLALVDAELHQLGGDPAGAQRILRDCAARVDALARRAGSRTLQFVIGRRAAALRRAGLRLALADGASAGRALAAAWPWVGAPEPGETGSAHPPGGAAAERFDREVAAELLEPPAAPKRREPASERELVSLFGAATAAVNDRAGNGAPLPLVSLQQSLDADTAFVAFLDGGTRGALLWVTRDDVRLLDTAAPDRLRTSIALLLDLLASGDSPVAEIQRAARALSMQLLGRMPPGPPPKHLLVRSGELMTRVAWNVLPWPGQQQPLVDSTDVRQVLLTGADDRRTAAGASPLHVFVAAQAEPGGALPGLAVAETEPRLIRAAAGDRSMTVATGSAATREALLAALEEPHAWVHVAAHGTARPDRLGYAGLWLDPGGAGETPQFLSWLDILDRGARADLVVLDACRLGDSGTAIDGNLSFADAVAGGGGRQVVSTMWPVSDAAAALWVPAFYAALNADPDHDAARALRAAQLRLRASREFRHPFFWSGMQAIAWLGSPAPDRRELKALSSR
jgi:tetratricopeptide (TPR) repeat protein